MNEKAAKGRVHHTVRTRDGGMKEIINMTPRQAIKIFCTECMGWDTDPKNCTATHCALYPLRGRTLITNYAEGVGE